MGWHLFMGITVLTKQKQKLSCVPVITDRLQQMEKPSPRFCWLVRQLLIWPGNRLYKKVQCFQEKQKEKRKELQQSRLHSEVGVTLQTEICCVFLYFLKHLEWLTSLQLIFGSFQRSPAMKLLLAAIVLIFLVEANAQWYKFPGQAVRGQPLDLWPFLLWTKLPFSFLTPTVRDCVQDLMICTELTGIWGRPTGRTQTNTFMPEETTTLPKEDQGADGPRRWSGECWDLCSLSDRHVELLLMLVLL